MDTDKLRSWLGLPPGPWPPDDRTLLGLGDGAVSAADAERRALMLMAKLRPHQLVNPDLVTEGMNRLAQALLAVSMAAPSAPAPPKPVARPATTESPSAAQSPAKVVAEDEIAPVAPKPVPAVPKPKLESGPIVLVPDVAGLSVPELSVGPLPADRRAAYRQLAGLRAVSRAWDRLRPFFADPSETVPTAGHVLDFLEATSETRTALRHPGLADLPITRAAPKSVAVASQPLALAVFRSLTSSQRLSLAKDWAMSRAWFEAYTDALRQAARRSATNRDPGTGRKFVRWLGANPEWMLATAAGVVFFLAGVRVILR